LSQAGEAFSIKQANTQLQKRVEFLQKRERELLEHLLKGQKERLNSGKK
jgi:FixJ family two-component response regulator